jgi:hypothetical protein
VFSFLKAPACRMPSHTLTGHAASLCAMSMSRSQPRPTPTSLLWRFVLSDFVSLSDHGASIANSIAAHAFSWPGGRHVN